MANAYARLAKHFFSSKFFVVFAVVVVIIVFFFFFSSINTTHNNNNNRSMSRYLCVVGIRTTMSRMTGHYVGIIFFFTGTGFSFNIIVSFRFLYVDVVAVGE